MDHEELKQFHDDIQEIKDDLLDLHRRSVSEFQFNKIERDVFILKMVVYGLPLVYLFVLLVRAAYRIGC